MADDLKRAACQRDEEEDVFGGVDVVDFDDPEHRHRYSGWSAYGASKLANILFTYELARRLDGNGVTVNAVHPGFVNTNFQRAAGLNMRGPLTPEVEGVTGKYFVRRRDTRSSDISYNQEVARRLCDVSAGMVGSG